MKKRGLWQGIDKKPETAIDTIEQEIFTAVGQNVTQTQRTTAEKVDTEICSILDDTKLTDEEKITAVHDYLATIEYKPELTEEEQRFVQDAKQHAVQWVQNERKGAKETAIDKDAARYSTQVDLSLDEIKLFLSAQARNKEEYQTKGQFDPVKYLGDRFDRIAGDRLHRLMEAVDFKLERPALNHLKELSSNYDRLIYLVDVMNEKNITGQEAVKQKPKSGEDDMDIDTPTSVTLDHNGFKAELEKLEVDMEVFRVLHAKDRQVGK